MAVAVAVELDTYLLMFSLLIAAFSHYSGGYIKPWRLLFQLVVLALQCRACFERYHDGPLDYVGCECNRNVPAERLIVADGFRISHLESLFFSVFFSLLAKGDYAAGEFAHVCLG